MKLFFFSTFRVNVGNHLGCRTKGNVYVLSDVVSHSHISCTDVVVARRDFITLHKSDAIFSVDVESDRALRPAHCFKQHFQMQRVSECVASGYYFSLCA